MDIPGRIFDELVRQGKEEERREKVRIRLERITMWAVIIYAGIAVFQYVQMRRANQLASDAVTNTRDSFREEQRPYVWLMNQLGSPGLALVKPPTGQILWSWHLTDYGKTPAYKLVRKQYIKLSGDKIFTPSWDEQSISHTPIPLPPNKDDFNTVISRPGITAQEFNALMQQDEGIIIRIVVNYVDSYGEHYETGICLGHLASGAIEYTEQGNCRNYIK